MKKLKISLVMAILLSMFTGCNSSAANDPEPTPSANPADSVLTVEFIDVGEGDAALIICDGKAMLVDGGGKDQSSKMYAILKERNLDHLELVIATNLNEEHIGGLAGALNYASAEKTLCGKDAGNTEAFSDFKKYADKYGNGLTVVHENDQFEFGSALIEILAVDDVTGDLLFKLTHQDVSFLFVPDHLSEDQQLSLKDNSKATVLKLSNHGKVQSTSVEFLKGVDCESAVLSTKGNQLDQDLLNLLNFASISLYRTDLHGDVVCTSDGKTVTFETEKNAEDRLVYQGSKTDQETDSSVSVDDPKPSSEPVVSLPSTVSIDELYEANLLTNLIEVYGTVQTISEYDGTSFINGAFKIGDEYVALNTTLYKDGTCGYSGWIDGYHFHDDGERVVMTAFVEELDGDQYIPGQQDLSFYFMYEECLKYLGKQDETYLFEFDYFTTVYTLTVDVQSLALLKVEYDTDEGKEVIEYIYTDWIPGQDIVQCWNDGTGFRNVSVYVDLYDETSPVSLYRPFYLPERWALEVYSSEQSVYSFMDANYTIPYSYPGDGVSFELYVTNTVG